MELLPVKLNINIDSKDLSPAVSHLIDKVSQAIGTVCRPITTVAQAAADSLATTITTRTELGLFELEQRTKARFYNEEIRKQQNRESILEQSIPLLEETAKPDEIENDWMFNFFDKAQQFEDKDMQALWAKILAGEANQPGSFSRQTINLMANISQKDALIFENFARLTCRIENDIYPVFFLGLQKYYLNHDINFETVTTLQELGLVNLASEGWGHVSVLPKSPTLSYFDQSWTLEPRNSNKAFRISNVKYTRAGKELFSILNVEPLNDFNRIINHLFSINPADMIQ